MLETEPILLVGEQAHIDDDCACPDKAFVLTFDHSAQVDETLVSHDCACPDTAFALRPTVESQRSGVYTQAAGTVCEPLQDGYFLAYSPYSPGGPSVLNELAWQRWNEFSKGCQPNKTIDAELMREMLIIPADSRPRPEIDTPQTLTAWMHVTNACNLDCPYCYVRKSSERMDVETGRRALDAIFKTAYEQQIPAVKLKYAGGEATLHFKLVKELHTYARKLATRYNLGLREVVLSNGVRLKIDDAEWMQAEGIKLMISLDGIGEMHDRLRPRLDGLATFESVAHTIDNILLPRGIRPDVTMTVTGQNAHGAADVARWVMVERQLPLSFNFYRQNALSADRSDLKLEETAIIDGMLAAYETIEAGLPERPFFNGLLDRVQAEAHAHTCGVNHSYVVVNHKGQLTQCQMHLDQPVDDHLSLNVLNQVRQGPIQNLSVDDKEGCRDCVYRYRCTGGCPLETFRATGRWDVQSPNCQIYQTLLPVALRLEGLRLLKVHGYLN